MSSNKLLISGSVYVLAHESKLYLNEDCAYKFGVTARPMEIRLKEINQSVQSDVVCIAQTKPVRAYKALEQILHNCLKDYRIASEYNKSLKEWYLLDSSIYLLAYDFLNKPSFYTYIQLLDGICDDDLSSYYKRVNKNTNQDYLETLQVLEINCRDQNKPLTSFAVKDCVAQFISKPTLLDYSLAINYLVSRLEQPMPENSLASWAEAVLFPEFSECKVAYQHHNFY